MRNWKEFRRNNFYRLKNGHKKLTCSIAGSTYLAPRLVYSESGRALCMNIGYWDARKPRDFVEWVEPEQQKKEKKMTRRYTFERAGKLYLSKKLAEMADGRWVMEVEGLKEPVTVYRSELSKVIPYTVRVDDKHYATHYVAVGERVVVD